MAAPDGNGFIVRYHPAGELRVGDVVSMEVISPPGADMEGQEAVVSLAGAGGKTLAKTLGKASFGGFIEGRQRAILTFAWDTRGLKPGAHRLRFAIPGRNLEWMQLVWLSGQAGGEAPRWTMRETDCCRVHYITGTAAERDIEILAAVIDGQANRAAAVFGVRLDEKLDINLFPRVLGQGGFAGDQIYISYGDRNYLNSDAAQLIRHEMVHRVDALMPGDLRPSIFQEGIAVYASGGHYKVEPVSLRAAALVDLGRYIPLSALADAFYPAQHESGYILAGALVEFMTQTWGWQRFQAFYRDIHEHESGSQAAAIDVACRRHFGLGLGQIEDRFLIHLEGLPVIPDVRREVELTIRLYDSIRAYQKALDPSAHFEQVWLPDAAIMREKGIVADYLRSPDEPQNRTVEALLLRAGRRLKENDYAGVETDLGQVARLLKPEWEMPEMIGMNSGAGAVYATTPR